MSVHVPPAYGDIPDSGGRQERASSHDSTDQPLTSSHPTRIEMNSSSQTDQSKEFGISPPSSVGRLNEFDSEGRAEEEIPNNHQPMQLSTPVFSSDYLPKSNQNSTIHGQEPGSGYISPRSEVPYKQNIQSPPYYEPNAEKQLHSPPSYRHSDESSHVKAADHAVTPGSPYYDNHRGSQPSSPRQYQNNSGMGIPHHHAPIAVASARTHVLPLLSDESHDLQNRSLLGSAVSLTSSASEDESSEPERNRDSRKIEV